jgi:hypothetical protein
MATKYDVEVVHHDVWDLNVVSKMVREILHASAKLYPKLLDSVAAEQREPAVRARILEDVTGAQQFAVNHPRLFKLTSSEETVASSERQQHLFALLYIQNQVQCGAIERSRAHDAFVQLSLDVAKKSPDPAS